MGRSVAVTSGGGAGSLDRASLEALRAYASANGRTWRNRLAAAWASGTLGDGKVDVRLRELRESVGVAGLAAVRFGSFSVLLTSDAWYRRTYVATEAGDAVSDADAAAGCVVEVGREDLDGSIAPRGADGEPWDVGDAKVEEHYGTTVEETVVDGGRAFSVTVTGQTWASTSLTVLAIDEDDADGVASAMGPRWPEEAGGWRLERVEGLEVTEVEALDPAPRRRRAAAHAGAAA